MNGTYYTITEVFDFGPHISKVILDYGKSMKGAAPSPEQFTVHVTRTSTEGEDFVWPNFMGDRPDDSMDGTRRVSNVYVSDKTGVPCEDGTCLTLELPCFIMEGIGSIIKINALRNMSSDQIVNVFICSTLPAGIRVTVIKSCSYFSTQTRTLQSNSIRKLNTIIDCNRLKHSRK